MSTIGEKLADARRSKGLSQVALAERARISADWVRKVEQGRLENPSLEYLIKVADALAIDPNDLIQSSNVSSSPGQGAVAYITPERMLALNAAFKSLQRLSPRRLHEMQKFLEIWAEIDDDEPFNSKGRALPTQEVRNDV